MKLLIEDFINTHSDWETLLAGEPYCVTTKRDGDYFLLKYSQFGSDFSDPLVRECRGSIFYSDGTQAKCVCQPFYKFGNFGENYADTIDWKTACVMEKVDGSLMKVWYHKGWHVSTNGTIDAYNAANAAYEGMTFGGVFDIALNNKTDAFCKLLNKDRVYMFELVSPYTRVTIPYDFTALYFLGSRDMRTMKEIEHADCPIGFADFNIRYPKRYPLKTLEDCINAVNQMTKDEEGFVVVDKDFHRIKIKSPEYLLAAHARNNGAITTKTVLSLLKEDKIDDFLGYCPDYADFVKEVCSQFVELAKRYETEWNKYKPIASKPRKEFALAVCTSPYKEYLFLKYEGAQIGAKELLLSKPLSKLADLVGTN